MFQVMDEDNNGYISLDEYLSYIDIMIYGTEEEKLMQSFQLLDLRQKGEIDFDDFNKIVHSFAKMWSAAIGTPTPINLEYVKAIFKEMTDNKPLLNVHE
jgi:Ca2+-binding EF-hand superfamily protein